MLDFIVSGILYSIYYNWYNILELAKYKYLPSLANITREDLEKELNVSKVIAIMYIYTYIIIDIIYLMCYYIF